MTSNEADVRSRLAGFADPGNAETRAIAAAAAAQALLDESPYGSRHRRQCPSCRALSAAESERKRIAADLHDGLGQSLIGLKCGVERALAALGTGAVDEAQATLSTLATRITYALDEVRSIAMNLRPSLLDDLGIVATLSWLVREFKTNCPDIVVDADVRIDEADVPEALKLTVFRIVQETLSNVARHAHASRVRLAIDMCAGTLRLVVSDNGAGFDHREVASRMGCAHGNGLAGLQDRVDLSGGSFSIVTARGRGVCLRVMWPKETLRQYRTRSTNPPECAAAGWRDWEA